MSGGQPRRGQIEYLKEGFIVHWDGELMSIEVIDYHATVLRLPWKDVLALARVASGVTSVESPKPRGKRDIPPEV